MRPSAVANCLPQWITVPMARSGPVSCEAARTMLMPSSAVGVAPARRHQGVHRAADRRIEQRGIPAAMHRAERVVVLELRRAPECRLAGLDRDQREVQRFGDVRIGQFAGQHGLHDLHAGLVGHSFGVGQAGFAAAGQQLDAHRRAFFHPLGQGSFLRVMLFLQFNLQLQQLHLQLNYAR